MSYDLKISGARIVDGTGGPAFHGDIGISDGRIVALGDAPDEAVRRIDADGRAVAPGFIDAHTHYDAQVLFDPMLSVSSWHGVTTAVGGNCGFGIVPMRREHQDLMMRGLATVEGMSYDSLVEGLGTDWGFSSVAEYLAAVERRGLGINFGIYAGHTPIRLYVMGEDATERAATQDEVARMRSLLRESLLGGALGFSTSKIQSHIVWDGRPAPSRAAEVAEILALADALGEAERGVFMAAIGPGFSIPEVAEVCRRTGRPALFAGIMTDMGGPGGHRTALERLAKAREGGHELFAQCSNRPLTVDFNMASPYMLTNGAPVMNGLPLLEDLFAPIYKAEKTPDRAAHYRDSGFRAEFRRATDGEDWLSRIWRGISILDHPTRRELEQRPIVDLAAERGVHPSEALLDVALESDLETRFALPLLNTDMDEIPGILRHPGTQLGVSDAGAHVNEICDVTYSTDLLGNWVRERQVFTLEEAVHFLSGQPARNLGLAGRGEIALGNVADLVLFDPDTVGHEPLRRVHDLPTGAPRLVSDAIGIDAVIVSGQVVREANTDVLDPARDTLPGKVIRG
jgi:N-acyl-D-aspartate/D-glutamate deacylase